MHVNNYFDIIIDIIIGRALNVRHFRQDQQCGAIEELPPIDSNPSYDFDYQVNNHYHCTSLCIA